MEIEIDDVLLALSIGWLLELEMAYLFGQELCLEKPQGPALFFSALAILVPYACLGYDLTQALVWYYTASIAVFLILGVLFGGHHHRSRLVPSS